MSLHLFLPKVFIPFALQSIGIKPLSTFGLVHKFEEKKIRASCVKDYPKVTEDLGAAKEVKGVLNLICDHLLDLDILKEPAMDGEQHDAEKTNFQTPDIESTQSMPDIQLQTMTTRPSLDSSQLSLLQ